MVMTIWKQIILIASLAILKIACADPSQGKQNPPKTSTEETRDSLPDQHLEEGSIPKKEDNVNKDVKDEEVLPKSSDSAPLSTDFGEAKKSKLPGTCPLNDILINKDTILESRPECSSYEFRSIKVLDGATLTIKEGVKLVSTDEKSQIEVEYTGALYVLGADQKRVSITGGDPTSPLRLSLFGAATLRNLDLFNATIRAWGARSEKNINTVNIDNTGAKVQDAAFECSNCAIRSMYRLAISNHEGTPAVFTLGSIGQLSSDSLQITGDTYNEVELYAGTHMIPRPGEKRRIPNLGHPYVVKTALLFNSDSFVIEPGVKLRLCEDCVLYGASKDLSIGEIGKEPVEFSSFSDKPWPGLYFYKSTMTASIKNTLILGTKGIQVPDCHGAAVSFEGGTAAHWDQVTLLPTSGGVMSLSPATTLSIGPRSLTLGQKPILYFRGHLDSPALATLEALGTTHGIQLNPCKL